MEHGAGQLAKAVAKALEQGYTEREQPYHGYYFKVLEGTRASRSDGRSGFRSGGGDDRRLRAGCCTGCNIALRA